MMTPKERIAEDRSNFRQQQLQQRAASLQDELSQEYSEPSRDETVKTNVDLQRNKAIGEMVLRHFPELQCFRPQLNSIANGKEFKLLDDFFAAAAALKGCYDDLQLAVNNKMTGRETSEFQETQTDNL